MSNANDDNKRLSTEELQAIKERCKKATSGPWILMPEVCGIEGQGVFETDSFGCICEVGDPYPRGNNRPQQNMEFIANARQDIPKLLAEIERLRETIKIARKEFMWGSVESACARVDDILAEVINDD